MELLKKTTLVLLSMLILVPLLSTVAAPSTKITATSAQADSIVLTYQGATPKTREFPLGDPKQSQYKYVIDLQNTTLTAPKIKSNTVSVAQFDPGTVRLVIQSASPLKKEQVIYSVTPSAGTIRVSTKKTTKKNTTPPKSPFPKENKPLTTAPAQTTASHKTMSVKIDEINEQTTKILLTVPGGVKASSFLLDKPRRAVVDLVGMQITDVQTPHSMPNLLKSIRTGKLTDPKSKGIRLVFDLGESATADAQHSSDTVTITLKSTLPPAPKKTEPPKKNFANIVVALDAGHGGYDSGAIYSGREEKDLTLQITQKVADILAVRGIRTIQTRTADRYLSLDDRTQKISDAKLFVSIHCNALNSNQDMNGLETYFFTRQSYQLAKLIHSAVISQTQANNRKIRKARFVVIKNNQIPSILIETGYMTNPSELQRLSDPTYQERVARGISNGIIQYLGAT